MFACFRCLNERSSNFSNQSSEPFNLLFRVTKIYNKLLCEDSRAINCYSLHQQNHCIKGEIIKLIQISSIYSMKLNNILVLAPFILSDVATLHKKWSFSLRISSVNVTKYAGSCGFCHILWRNPWWKTSFFVEWALRFDWNTFLTNLLRSCFMLLETEFAGRCLVNFKHLAIASIQVL